MLGKLIIFSAPSGSGKTTIIRHLLKQDFNLEFSVSATSRAIREEEINGKDYYFLSAKEFKQKIENDEFLEWEEVYSGCFYGTLKSEIERIRNKGNNVVFDVDVIGGINIKEYYKDDALGIFIQPPSIKELKKRLRGRNTETKEVIVERIKKFDFELSLAGQFDKIIINDRLELALKEVEKALTEFINK